MIGRCKNIIQVKFVVLTALLAFGLVGYAQEKNGALQQPREPWTTAIENYNFPLAIELINE